MLQTKLAREIVKDIKEAKKPRNKQTLLESVGYTKNVATHKAGEIIEQKGTQIAISVALEQAGLSEAKVDQVVQSILESKHEEAAARLKAADLIYKRMGSYAAEKSVSLTATASVDELREAVAKDIAKWQGNKPYNE
jgi:ribosomal protein L22